MDEKNCFFLCVNRSRSPLLHAPRHVLRQPTYLLREPPLSSAVPPLILTCNTPHVIAAYLSGDKKLTSSLSWGKPLRSPPQSALAKKAIRYVTLRLFYKNIYRRINKILAELLWLQLVRFMDWWAGVKQLLRETHESNWEKDRFFKEPDHDQVLKALSKALKKRKEAYLNMANKIAAENPELALMGSFILVMMKGKDVYLMNVGDSRAVLAQTRCADPQCIKEETFNFYGDRMSDLRS